MKYDNKDRHGLTKSLVFRRNCYERFEFTKIAMRILKLMNENEDKQIRMM